MALALCRPQADRRPARHATDLIKRQKNLAQADAMINALYVTDPFGLDDAIEDARGQGGAWAKAIDRSMAEIAGRGVRWP